MTTDVQEVGSQPDFRVTFARMAARLLREISRRHRARERVERALAAKDVLGTYWWTPLVPVAVASAWCLWSVKKEATAYGPYALTFYERFGSLGPLLARTQLLADLDKTFKLNEVRVANKQKRLRRSLITLVLGLAIAGSLIAVTRPTTITSSCMHAQIRVPEDHHQFRCQPLRTSPSSGQAGSSAAATTKSNG